MRNQNIFRRLVLFGLLAGMGLACTDSTDSTLIGATASGDALNGGDSALADGQQVADNATNSDTAAAGDSASDGAVLPGADAAIPDGAVPADVFQVPDVSSDVLYADAMPATYTKCSALIQCVQLSCGASFPPGCDDVCTKVSSLSVSQAYAQVSVCIEQTCRQGVCKGATDVNCVGNCVGNKCIPKIAMCGADGKTGSATCWTALTCFGGCKDKGADCLYNCFGALSAGAQSDYQALEACSTAAGGADPFKVCPEQTLKCVSEAKVGTQSCIDVLSCFTDCTKKGGNDLAQALCVGACYGAGTQAAQSQFIGVAKCFDKGNGPGCTDAYVTCADPSGTKTCVETLSCLGDCNKNNPDNTGCAFGCVHKATKTAATKLLQFTSCLDTQCKPICNGNAACEEKCKNEKCSAQLAGCATN